jgi:hypothetical protein
MLFNKERVGCFGNFKRVKGEMYGGRRVMTMNGSFGPREGGRWKNRI